MDSRAGESLAGMALKKGLLLLLALAVVNLPAASTGPRQADASAKPNILFILTDDLDYKSDLRMDNLRELVKRRGTTFDNAFVTIPQCCPSRASILTGKYAHNHRVIDNLGAAPKLRSTGGDRSTVATWLNSAGYRTIFIGKYLNDYNGRYIPPGWDSWRAQSDNKYRFNVNGDMQTFDKQVHMTDLLSDWAADYIHNGAGKKQPFFMYLATNAPHGPDDGAAGDEKRFKDVVLPRPPNFNERDVSDKPQFVRAKNPLSSKDVGVLRRRHRDRLRSLLSVDRMLGRLVGELRKSGELENTYIVFTSDNGYHLGQHRLRAGKGTAYEEDIRVPLYVRGPGVPAGQHLQHKVLNIDWGPTFADLGGTQAPVGVDGRSFVPLLRSSPPPVDAWRESFLVEYWHFHQYKALRTGGLTYVEYENGERELYDLDSDPFQLKSLDTSPEHEALIDRLHTRLQALKQCSGQRSCEAAESSLQ